MPNANASALPALIRGHLPDPMPLVSLFHPGCGNLLPRGYPGNPSTTLAVLICQCGMWNISCSLFLPFSPPYLSLSFSSPYSLLCRVADTLTHY